MAEIKVFPDDLSALSDAEVLKNIQYLMAHYRKYKIDVYGNETMRMDNVHIVLFDIIQHGNRLHIAKVNNKKVSNVQNKELYGAIRSLYKICQNDKIPMKTKIAQKWQEIRVVVLAGAIITVVISGGLMICAYINQRQKQKKEEMVREALRIYQEAQQSQKTIVVDDIVNQVVR